MKRFCLVLALVASVLAAVGQSADESYVRIYNTIQEADTLAANLQHAASLQKYQEAQAALQQFQKGNPDWNLKIIRFRLSYVAERIAELEPKVPTSQLPKPAPRMASAGTPAQEGAAVALEAQLNVLRDQVRLLEADRGKLEAKLKEALALQPASVDPRELSKAEKRIQDLQKENDLLKVNLEQAQARQGKEPSTGPQPGASTEDLTRQLKEQADRLAMIEMERNLLSDRLAKSGQGGETNRAALTLANQALAEHKEAITRLTAERDGLQERIKAANSQTESALALRAENDLLKKQLQEARERTASAPAPTSGDDRRSETEARLAVLQSENEILSLEKKALQWKVQELRTAASGSASPATVASARPNESRAIRDLERERDKLRKNLDAANRQLASRKKGGSGRIQELENEVTDLKLKVDVLEAAAVPYTPEELALFNMPQSFLAAAPELPSGPAQKRPAPSQFSASTAPLAREAQRHFAAGRLDQAEEKFLEVLKQDQNDLVTLGNLAVVQLDLNHLDAAEKHINQALTLAPADAFSLAVLGRLRFQQKRMDDALEVLSRAAKLDPGNAEIQNYMGLVLSEKGMRPAAESALRRAVQLRPTYGSAHQNLAVVYLSQNPPLVELARYHYNKSLAAGTPPNPRLETLIESKRTIK